MARWRVLAQKFGLMRIHMLVNGVITKRMGRVFFITQMAMSIRDSGSTIRPMVRELIFTRMELNMLEIGKITNRMGKELRSGLMDRGMKDSKQMI